MTHTSLQKLTAETALEFKNVHDAQISPDGSIVAFEVTDRYKLDTKTPRGAIWSVSTAGGDARPFTAGTRRDRHPRWSPDSQWLAFLSDRAKDGEAQIYLMARGGGEAVALTSETGHIEELEWSADGRQIFFLMIDPQTEQERQREAGKDDVVEFEEHPKYARIYALDVATKSVRPMTGERIQAWEFDVAADGARTALVAADNPFEWSWYQSRIGVISGPDAPEQVLHRSKRQLAHPRFSPDGKWIAFLTSTWSDRGVTSGDLYIVQSNGSGEARNLTPDYGGSVSWMQWSADSRSLVFLALESMESTFGEIDIASGTMRHLWSGPVGIANPNQQAFSMARDGSALVCAREAAGEAREVWLGRRAKSGLEWTRLTHIHVQSGDYHQTKLESIQWKGADGRPMQGFVLKPHDYDPARRYPMVTAVHGGPTSAWTWFYPLTTRVGWIELLAESGVVVFMPNPRGSVGWGLRFAESNVGDMGGKDFQDVMAGIDYLVASGVADEKRLGLAGWSYGGFMTMWGVSQTDRFKAAMAGAGIANWKSFHGLTKYPTFDALFYAADPYDSDKEAAYELFSPLTYIKRIKTPTLVIHGEKDPDVPSGQAYEFHRALKDHGVETQLAIYPRELHGFSEKAHIVDMWNRVTQWFVTRLLG